MPILQPVIRPPAEADSFLLQVTLGCSVDTCTFCGAYKNKPFRIKDPDEIASDIDRHAKRYPDTRRVFLMDGDAMVLANAKMVPILHQLQRSFPKLSRVATYANGINILRKNDDELAELRQHQLSLLYMGLESGDQATLDRCHKASRVDDMVIAVRKAAAANIKSSVIVLLGLGGKTYSREHVQGTINALNNMQPRYLSFLSLMVIPQTPLAEDIKSGMFVALNSFELLKEAHDIIDGLHLAKTIFRSDHASNHLPLEGSFPKDKIMLLEILKAAMQGKISLRPELLRGL